MTGEEKRSSGRGRRRRVPSILRAGRRRRRFRRPSQLTFFDLLSLKKKNLKKQLQDDLDATLDSFRDTHGDVPRGDDLTILVPKQDDPTDQIFVFFPEEPKVVRFGVFRFFFFFHLFLSLSALLLPLLLRSSLRPKALGERTNLRNGNP